MVGAGNAGPPIEMGQSRLSPLLPYQAYMRI